MKPPIVNLAGRISLRPAEAAEVTGLSESVIKRQISNGSLPSRKLDGARLIRVKDLQEFIDGLDEGT